MILPLRKLHRRLFAVFGIALPLLFTLGIAARKPPALVDNLPPELTPAPTLFNALIGERPELFSKTGIGLQLLRERVTSGAFAVRFVAPKDFAKPDVIVYWVAGQTASAEALPDDAQLLGAFSARELKLPAAATTSEGRLIVFSLADQEIVDVSKPFVANVEN